MKDTRPITFALPAVARHGARSVNQDHTDNILIVMRWAPRQHYQNYRNWREANGDVKCFGELTTGGLSTRFFDVTDV